MSNVLIFTDSLGLPRDSVDFDDTWIKLLSDMYPEVTIIDRPEYGKTTEKLPNEKYVANHNADIVITQLGIVDCAPRYFNASERCLFDCLSQNKTYIYKKCMRKIRSRNPRRTYVSTSDFRKNLDEFYQGCQEIGVPVYSIIIAPSTEKFENKSPQIENQINKYNNIYRELAESFDNLYLLDPYAGVEDIESIMVKYEHPNAIGHERIAEAVKYVLPDTEEVE